MPFQRRRKCIFHWRGLAWLTNRDKVKIPRYSHKLMHRKRVTRELYNCYFCSMTIKTCHSKNGGSAYSDGQLRGDIEWVLNYYITQCTENLTSLEIGVFGDKMWLRKPAPSRKLGPRASGWAALENGKETLMAICCSSVVGLQLPLTLNPFK